MIIGPYLGFAAALFGGFITAGSVFDILTSFSPAVSALIAGFLTQKYVTSSSKTRGWMVAAAVLGLLILLWYATGIGQQAPLYPMLHLAGFVFIVGTRGWTAKVFGEGRTMAEHWHVKTTPLLGGITAMIAAYMFTQSYAAVVWVLSYLSLPVFLIGGGIIVYSLFGTGKGSFVLAVSLASYCGIIADHMLGNLVFINSIDLFIPFSVIQDFFLKPLGLSSVPQLFMYTIPISTAERTMLTVVATIFGVGLILALRRGNLLHRRLED
jgi:hypothetical protein